MIFLENFDHFDTQFFQGFSIWCSKTLFRLKPPKDRIARSVGPPGASPSASRSYFRIGVAADVPGKRMENRLGKAEVKTGWKSGSRHS